MPRNIEIYAGLIIKTFAVLFGAFCIVSGALWKNIQLATLPQNFIKCSDSAKIFDKTIDVNLTLIIIGAIIVVLGFGDTASMIIRAIKNGRKK